MRRSHPSRRDVLGAAGTGVTAIVLSDAAPVRASTAPSTRRSRDLIIKEGYDPVYGARPLKRAIQNLVQNPLAVSLLKGEILSGSTVRAKAEDGQIRFAVEGAKSEAVA